MQLNNELKRLLKDLGHAINESVSESERIGEAIARVRAAGYEIVIKLDATIGLARREPTPAQMTPQDRRFLEALHIRVDDVERDEPSPGLSRIELTPQDIRFLKSLKISLDDDAR
ncbi:MAG: hypothetical protein K6U09_05280 [Acidobacteriia bacterium]|nr:hypothetical protein [Terriglobia bacterium]